MKFFGFKSGLFKFQRIFIIKNNIFLYYNIAYLTNKNSLFLK
jgi:hypothetical protein